jgi:hypothetical protein
MHVTLGVPEVKRMESRPEVLLENVRQGFAAAYEGLQVDESLRVSNHCHIRYFKLLVIIISSSPL